ncbi:MAG: heat-inducible transcriptional repressor HrcA [Limnochordia bacterium]|jgi:heat-inducible transcriptional repressor
MMNERKREILRAVTKDYISTAEPVGSRTIARKYDLGVSPATIRNEMADLEEGGYLRQPHTSAGRIPSDKGYRFYVDALMDPLEVTPAEKKRIAKELQQQRVELEEIIYRTTHLLALLTNYTSIAVAPGIKNSVVRYLQLLPLSEAYVLVILVTEPGFVQTRLVEVNQPLSAEKASRLSAFLNGKLQGLTLNDLDLVTLTEIKDELADGRLFQEAIELLQKGLQNTSTEKVYLDGAIHLFDQPEFKDVDRARLLLEALEERERLLNICSEVSRDSGVVVRIGEENNWTEMQDCSLITATYTLHGQVIGVVGVIGPTRMEYARAVSVVDYMAAHLSEILTDMSRRWSGK